jgi:hypothetical protein
MNDTRERRREAVGRWALPLATLALMLVTATGYGIFRDELYYLSCSRRLAWGYVDQPPLVALLAALVRAVAGESLVALRALPAAALAATVLLAGDTARALGGGRWARLLAQLLTATAPVFLALASIFSMNAFDLLVWAGLSRLAVTLLAGGSPRLWLAFGALAGVGLENKLDVGLLGAGLAAGILAARRDLLRERWLWLGAGLAVALFLPHVIWQVAHGFPTREFVANAQGGKIVALGPLGFIAAQAGTVGPIAALMALAGFVWLLAASSSRPYRPLGLALALVLATFAFSPSKPYYFAPAFPLLFAAAGVALEGWTARRAPRWTRRLAVGLAASVLIAAPLAKPLLPVEDYLRYAARLGQQPGSDERHEVGRLPQYFADMHGWRELAGEVGRVAAALPESERARLCVFANNYGQAGAIEHFRRDFRLPPVISGHNNWWLWGPGACTGEVLLILGGDVEDYRPLFASVEAAGQHHSDLGMPYENVTLWLARGPRTPLAEVWPAVRHYD